MWGLLIPNGILSLLNRIVIMPSVFHMTAGLYTVEWPWDSYQHILLTFHINSGQEIVHSRISFYLKIEISCSSNLMP